VANSTSSKANRAWSGVQSIASRIKYWHQVQEIPFSKLAKCSAHSLKIIFFGNVINLNKNLTRMQHMDKTRRKYMSYLWFQLASLSCWNGLRKVNLLHTQYNTVSFCYTVIQNAPWCTGRTSGASSTGHLEQKNVGHYRLSWGVVSCSCSHTILIRGCDCKGWSKWSKCQHTSHSIPHCTTNTDVNKTFRKIGSLYAWM